MQRLAHQQKAYNQITIDVLKSGWDLNLALLEVEGAKMKRLIAEKQLERAAMGLSLLPDEEVYF